MSEASGSRRIVVLDARPGHAPFEKWYRGLRDEAARAAVLRGIVRLKHSEFSGFKGVGAGVQELRIFPGPGYRVHFAVKGELLVIPLGGGVKDTQKHDVAEAKRLWKAFKNETERYQRDFLV